VRNSALARAAALALALGLVAASASAAGREPVERLIVGLRPEAGMAQIRAAETPRIRSVLQRTGLRFRAEREINASLRVVDLEIPVTGADLADALARLTADPDVAFAEPDGRLYRHAVAADNLFPNQWYLQNVETAALDNVSGWDVTTGSAGMVVAVLDTGVRFDHPDLLQAGRGGRLLPGRDFVRPDSGAGGFKVANDGDGWDANPSDPGDWVTSAEADSPLFDGCEVSDSSWHGTRVAGLIGAITNNGEGIAGGTWNTWILPVRVLGKCFGNNSDIMTGMRWAAGLHIAGVPDNPYPARIINMSLGSEGSCSQAFLNVLNDLASAGVLVVASAGNSDGPVDTPANCPGVAAVAGLRHIGTKVGYSSFGPEVALAAPGGNCVNDSGPCLFSLDTTVNLGTTGPGASSYTDQTNANVGTSFSAPLVAGIAALMQSVNGNLRAPQLIARLRQGARPFPPPPQGLALCQVGVPSSMFGCACTTSTCGAGMANAPGSLAAAARPIAAIAVPSGVSAGQNVALNGIGSAAACGRAIATWQWTPVGVPPAGGISGADTATATVVAPSGSASFIVRLTVMDDEGATDTADVTVRSTSAMTTAPASAGTHACLADITPTDPGPSMDDGPPRTSSGGGGGAWSWLEILVLVTAVVRRIRTPCGV
jgi:serine protease